MAAAGAAGAAAAAATAAAGGAPEPVAFEPLGAAELGWQIWAGAAVGVAPFILGAWEFGTRIQIQRKCVKCSGSGLVGMSGKEQKCPECGGFFPWRSWGEFLGGTRDPGNGGPLLQPRGQRSVLYTVPEDKAEPGVGDGGGGEGGQAEE